MFVCVRVCACVCVCACVWMDGWMDVFMHAYGYRLDAVPRDAACLRAVFLCVRTVSLFPRRGVGGTA